MSRNVASMASEAIVSVRREWSYTLGQPVVRRRDAVGVDAELGRSRSAGTGVVVASRREPGS